MKNNSAFINDLQSITPNTQNGSIDPKEVEYVESYFNNMLDDWKLAKNSRGHSVPAAIFNF